MTFRYEDCYYCGSCRKSIKKTDTDKILIFETPTMRHLKCKECRSRLRWRGKSFGKKVRTEFFKRIE